ncbi:orc1/cdc6 family replication initiation protein [Halocatena pleomorpha]|uniref:ORC1-type DNA replication protein n=1 Tax=Halocatena pleomorpha TaxID=1785090 RepID=A0A3P3RC22_9EURY|nr:orc1/cdc6 family replication initiation protein [Halocatena pleomorpha]RRJ30508.1 cell division control protein Cdc6 [Halocatena pleomorpha]
MNDPFEGLTSQIFENKHVLEEDYDPETILEREAEIEAYRNALKDVLFGRSPSNIFIYGKTGVGKTAVTRYMMDALQYQVNKRDEADRLHVLFHNCNNDSAYGTLRAFINTLRNEDAPTFPKKGLSTSDALEEFYSLLDDIGGTFLLVLDEIDHLAKVNSLLYEIPRARSNGHLDHAKIGVIGISNNYRFRDSLSPKVKGTLMEKELSFSPYDADELRTILSHRAEKAFVEDAYVQSAIALCAAKAAQDTGSARQALDLLSTGGDIAEDNSDDTVTDDHILAAETRVQRGRVRNKIRDQTPHAQLILEAIAQLEESQETPVRSKTIQSTYEQVATYWGTDPLSSLRSVQDHLSELKMLGFLSRTERNDGRAGGAYYEYELAMDADAVFTARKEIEEEGTTSAPSR